MAIIYYFVLLIFTMNAWSQVPSEVGKSTSKYLSVDFASWQEEGTIKGGNEQSKFVLTNKAWCLGGGISKETKDYITFIDGCFLYGSGNVGSEKNVITYNQSSINLWGGKASIGAGKFVSPARVEIGFKIPIMYVQQTFDEPAGSDIREPVPFMIMGSLYSRWAVKKWFVQTEFGKIVGNDFVFYSVGLGHSF